MTHYIDADKLIAEIRIIQQSLESRDVYLNQVKKIRTECSIEFCKCILDVITSLQQEQPQVADASKMEPEVDLEKEYKTWWNSISGKINVDHIMEWYMHETARRFYELGKNARKEG